MSLMPLLITKSHSAASIPQWHGRLLLVSNFNKKQTVLSK